MFYFLVTLMDQEVMVNLGLWDMVNLGLWNMGASAIVWSHTDYF